MSEYDQLPLSPQTRQRHGCFFYGCLFSIVLGVLLIVGVGLGTYSLYRFAVDTMLEYTDTEPAPLPKVEITPDEEAALHTRLDAFKNAVDKGQPVEPLILSSEDVNQLIAENPDFQGKVYIELKGREIEGQISAPVEEMLGSSFKGRYLNGKAKLNALLQNGRLLVFIDSLEVKGQSLPEQFMAQLRQKNLAERALENPKIAELIRKYESIEIKDGKLIVTPRKPEAETKKQEEGKEPEIAPSKEEAIPSAKPEAAKPKTKGLEQPEPQKDAAPAAKP